MAKIKERFKKLVRRLVQADATTDPDFFGKLGLLPNPDVMLRKMGKADQVYASIMADPHVFGDIRSMMGALRGKDYRLVTGEQGNAQADKALEVCKEWISSCKPNNTTSWRGLLWQFNSAVLTGRQYHELLWDEHNGYIVPVEIIDRKISRFNYDTNANLLLRTKANRDGELVDDRYFVQSRHMASQTNPYGVAILSSLFWMWTFKTGGFKYFVQYCERHGIPWAIGRYPVGTPEPDQEELEQALARMLESAYAAVPDGTGIELLTPKASGTELPQEKLIVRCNKEMSKALTGQAMVAELDGVGANAASQTAKGRQDDIHDSDNDISAASMERMFRLITDINVGVDAPSPMFEYYDDEAAGKDRAEVYETATRISNKVSKKAFHKEFKIPMAEDEEDVLKSATPQPGSNADFNAWLQAWNFNKEWDDTDLASQAADHVIANDFIDPAKRMLDSYIKEGKDLAEFQDDLAKMLITIDDKRLLELTADALGMQALEGMDDAV